MKVAQINSECGRGSTGKIVVAISKVLTQNGVDNRIFFSGNHKSKIKYAKQINSKLELRLHQALSYLFGDQGFHSFFTTVRLVKQLKRYDPDIIQLHNIHGYYLHSGVLFSYLKKAQKPVVWTFHDCWPITGHCTHFTISKCEKWTKECNKCPSLKEYPYSLLFDRSKELYQRKKKLFTGIQNLTVVTPSDWLAGIVKRSYLHTADICTIHNGIDMNVFRPVAGDFKEQYGCKNKRILLGVASVWSDKKGLDVFIELFYRLDPSNYQIVLVGTDKDVDKRLPQGILSIHRTQNQNELATIYSAADIFINPTREDNYPTVNMEAVACGTPVISFNTGGASEILSGGCGRVLCANDVDMLVQEINSFFECDAEVRFREACNCKRTEFDQEKTFLRYYELYKEIYLRNKGAFSET